MASSLQLKQPTASVEFQLHAAHNVQCIVPPPPPDYEATVPRRGVVNGRIGWGGHDKPPTHFCRTSFLRLMRIRPVYDS